VKKIDHIIRDLDKTCRIE